MEIFETFGELWIVSGDFQGISESFKEFCKFLENFGEFTQTFSEFQRVSETVRDFFEIFGMF